MISAFEYVTVLISIILGLGITQILTGIADLIHKSERVKLYWPHLIWILFVLLLHIQEWWVTYELKNYHPWRLPTFLFIMAYPVNLFVLARLLFPYALKTPVIDLKTFYFHNYRKIFLVFAISAFLSIAYNLGILKLAIESQVLQVLLASMFMLIAARKVTEEWVHKSLVLLVFLVFVISLIIEWDVWLIE